MSFWNTIGKNSYMYILRMGRKLVKSKKRYGRNATFVELYEVGVYGNRHSLMPDLNGNEWTGYPKWLDE